ncbi:hypothetical protein M9Y10_030879 [Tritrichomonas musculus]|uniref:Uncharacterized protein n=1 Tax=Tritrichomonas musculus TaxID=1915356 RepID=A0ABR2H295_9EUKA
MYNSATSDCESTDVEFFSLFDQPEDWFDLTKDFSQVEKGKEEISPKSTCENSKDLPPNSPEQRLDSNVNVSVQESVKSANAGSQERQFSDNEILDFRHQFCLSVSKKKAFCKKIVQKIHNNFLVNGLNFFQMKRGEHRNIKKEYFGNYISKKEEILKYLRKNKDQIINQIPELKLINNF